MTELDFYIAKIDEQYTFFGVLQEYYDTIFHRCKQRTRSDYNGDYNNHILPLLGDKTIANLTFENYEEAVNNIKEKRDYAEATIQHFRYLIRAVVKCAAERGICEDVLFGSVFAVSPNDSDRKKKEYLRNRKSLKVDEERRLYDMLFSSPEQSGTHMGLALMLGLGLRNNEACGLKFGAIKPMESHAECSCAWIYATTVDSTNVLKPGGKTRNAPRILPLPPNMLKLIDKRKTYLLKQIHEGKLDLNEGHVPLTLDDLPIVCKDDDFKSHCSSRDLTTAGKLLLKNISVSEDAIAYISAELQDEDNEIEMGVREKDPTSYLLRRNLGTHLHILGLTESEIQYYMGHDMEDVYATRNEYTNEEQLYKIYKKLLNRPLFNDEYPNEQCSIVSLENQTAGCAYEYLSSLFLSAKQKATAFIEISAAEPDDKIRVFARGDGIPQVKYTLLPDPSQGIERTVNVLRKYHEAYKKTRIREE